MTQAHRRHTVLDLICPPHTDMLRLIRNLVSCLTHEQGFTSEQIGQIEIAVDEACTNVICHAYGGDVLQPVSEEAELRITVRAHPDHLMIQVIDHGTGMPEGRALGVGSLEEYATLVRPSGLGSFIISNFMDEVAYESPDGAGTVLSMVKYRNQPL